MAKAKKSVRAVGGPEAIMPLTDFRGDPWGSGDKNAVSFKAGILSSPVPAEFAQAMRDDGKAAPASDHPKPPKPKAKAGEESAPTGGNQPAQD